MSLLFIALTACDLFNAESVGAYTCDEYCGEVIDKTDECAEEACAADPDCASYTDEEMAEYAAEGRDDWAGASRDEMLASCESDLASAGKSDTECQAETAVLNNISCTDLLGLLGQIRDGA
jgi:hypothetical protein